MSYFLTNEQQLLRDTVRTFARKEIEPIATKIDREERTPTELIGKIAQVGLFGLFIPEAFGGAGESLVTACIVLEELAKASPALAGLVSVQMVLCPGVVMLLGSENQKQRLLPLAASGGVLMAYSQTEPSGSGNIQAHRTRLVRDNNVWRLNGDKLFCTQGEATIYLVMCRTSHEGHDGYGCVIVERGAKGFEVAPYEDKLGWRGTNTGGISFTNVEVTPEQVLGNVLTGNADHWKVSQASFIAHCATSLGCVEGLFDKTLEQVKARKLYGSPMHSLSPISYRLADVFNKIEAMRCLLYDSARLWDERRVERQEASVCKAYICDTAFDCTNTLLQMWGGSGIMNSTGVNRYFRDARTNMIAEGASEMHTAIVAETVLGLGSGKGLSDRHHESD